MRRVMFSSMKRIGVVALVGVAALMSAVPEVQAQSPYFQVRPGLTLQQYAYNIATLGQAYSFVPPYAMGFNPYRGGFNPYLGAGAYNPGIASLYNPAASLYSNPYLSTATMASNPY